MNRAPFPFRDFVRVKQGLLAALTQHDECYALLVGDTGTGKTALLRELRCELDRARFRVLYFAQARKLGAAGLVKVIGEALRVRISMCHSLTLDRLQRTLAEESQRVLVWLDEAHDLSEETLCQARALAESDLDGQRRVHVLLAGLPRLRAELALHPHLWRRIVVREEITGLGFDELEGFLEHHFEAQSKRLDEAGLRALFERGKGAPGLLLPMYKSVLARASAKGKIETGSVEEALERWDLP
jgi:type II secretory pathway predicted ATPase ExeA